MVPSFLEFFALQVAIAYLTVLQAQTTNTTEKAAIQATIVFLQSLLGTVSLSITPTAMVLPEYSLNPATK